MDRTNTLTMLGNRGAAGPYIELLLGKGKGKLFELTRDQLSIGRSEESDIQFPSDAVSRVHAYLSRQETSWHIRDNGSKNGILVNGVKTETQCLESGDLVQVGDFVFRFIDPSTVPAKQSRRVHLGISGRNPAILRVKPSPVWLFGAGVGALVYFLLAPSLVPKKATMKRELVISAPAELAARAADLERVAQAALEDAKPARPAVPAVPKPPVPVVAAQPSDVRPITRDDLAIKTRKKGKKVEPGKELKIYIEEGEHYLSQGDFESATIAFNFAILIDPRNELAIQGMQAAQAGVRDLSSVPGYEVQAVPEKPAPQKAKESQKQLVKQLFEVANAAILQKKYQKAVDSAEEIRKIEIKGETVYLNEAKQIIDQAKQKQKEEFEPFLKQANSMISEGAFRTARELCDQMLKRDEFYRPAKECRDRADAEMTRQASSKGGTP